MPVALAGSIALALSGAQAASAAETALMSRLPRATPRLGARRAVRGATARRRRVRGPPRPLPATYTVQPGDTVSAIAGRFGLRTADVLALNGLGWQSLIYPGQVLQLTGARGPPLRPAPRPPRRRPRHPPLHDRQRGDTISAIAARHGVSTQAVLSRERPRLVVDHLPRPDARDPGGARLAAAPAAPGDSAAGRARRARRAARRLHGQGRRHDQRRSRAPRRHASQAVLTANGLGWSSIIYPGQTLIIPVPPALRGAPRSIAGLDAEQPRNARIIVQVGRELGVPDRGIAIALGTAMQESWLRNLDWGDRDSLGLFQQRPSTGWGTRRADPRPRPRDAGRSTAAPSDPNGAVTRGLLDIPGWQSHDVHAGRAGRADLGLPRRLRAVGAAAPTRGSPRSADAPIRAPVSRTR